MLSCPKCSYVQPEEQFNQGASNCPSCQSVLDIIAFPALYNSSAIDSRTQAGEEDARCAYHESNQADKICSECGRLICSLCAIQVGKAVLCPRCLNRSSTSAVTTGKLHSVVWDSLALSLVAHPALLLIWYLTPITALASLTISIFNFGKPTGPLRRSRWRYVVSIILSITWIAGWIIGLIYLIPFLGKLKNQ